MNRSDSTKRFERWYARLLRLYPKSYQRQFSEPMRQTFGDMCREQREAGGDMLGFVVRAYADTGIGIIKECAREVVTTMKTSKTRLLIVGGSVAVLVTVATTAYLLNSRSPSVIPPMSSLKEARELSQGNKESCFADNKQAIQAVRADDKYLDEAKEFSNFELTASSGIKDVPAGTNYETTIHSYKNGMVTGAAVYEKDYGKYNYKIKKLPAAGEWEFVSMVACK